MVFIMVVIIGMCETITLNVGAVQQLLDSLFILARSAVARPHLRNDHR